MKLWFVKFVKNFPRQTFAPYGISNEVICRYGVPSGLHSDQGANLCSSVIYSLCDLLGIATTRTSAYHPEGNGQVERFNRTLQSILAKTVDTNQDTWDSQLPKALFAYRTAVHETTDFTPFYLTFARSPQLPVDVMLGCVLPATLRSYPQFVQDAHKQMAAYCNIAQQHLQAYSVYTTRRYVIKTLLLCHFLLAIGCGYIHLWCLRARQKHLLHSGKVPIPL